MTHSPRFQSRKTPPALLVQNGRYLQISLVSSAHLRSVNHAATLRQAIPPCESPFESILFAPLAILTHLIMGEALGTQSLAFRRPCAVALLTHGRHVAIPIHR